jgi:hypothetical protein
MPGLRVPEGVGKVSGLQLDGGDRHYSTVADGAIIKLPIGFNAPINLALSTTADQLPQLDLSIVAPLFHRYNHHHHPEYPRPYSFYD